MFSYPYVPTQQGLLLWDPVAIQRSTVSGTVNLFLLEFADASVSIKWTPTDTCLGGYVGKSGKGVIIHYNDIM